MPPFVAVAVKVTAVPWQILVVEAEIETLGVTVLFTVILIGVALAVFVLVHEALLVMMTDTWLPFVKVVLVNVALFVPALLPFTSHW